MTAAPRRPVLDPEQEAARLRPAYLDDEEAAATAAQARFDAFARHCEAWLGGRGVTLACAPGCAHCCHSLVSLTPPEAFRLAAHVDAMAEGGALKARIVAHAAAHGRKDGAARMRGRVACPCLDPETALCAVHPARPLTCRGMNSVDAAPCRAALETDDPALPIPTALAMHEAVQALCDAFGALAREAGAAGASVELAGALATIWKTPDAAGRWRRGEDVFAACRATEISGAAAPRFG